MDSAEIHKLIKNMSPLQQSMLRDRISVVVASASIQGKHIHPEQLQYIQATLDGTKPIPLRHYHMYNPAGRNQIKYVLPSRDKKIDSSNIRQEASHADKTASRKNKP
jgi:hypothetical protein